jgi:putative tryptophan/tyrosine transport system substrate-binding protein
MVARRSVVSLLVRALPAVPLLARSQTGPNRSFRLGYLSTGALISGAPERGQAHLDALIQGLRELGYVEGRNVRYELRFAHGNLDLLPSTSFQ